MKVTSYLEKVAEFHSFFGQSAPPTPKIPNRIRLALREGLIKEELDELVKAFNAEDLVEIADALADLQYVLSGTILELGLHNIFDELFNEVHSSNMSKACASRSEAEETVAFYQNKGQCSHITLKNGKYIVLRDDGKVLKSINYKKADLHSIINRELQK